MPTQTANPANGLFKVKLGAPIHQIPRNELPANIGPNVYGVGVDGDCLSPAICDGDLAIGDPDAECKPGDFVILIPASGGRPLIKRLVMLPPPFLMNPAPGSEVVGLVEVEMLNPQGFGSIAADKLTAVHRVIHVLEKGSRKPRVLPTRASARKSWRVRRGTLKPLSILGTELAHRYLCWLDIERNRLSQELGTYNDGRIVIYCDRLATNAQIPHDGSLPERPSDRAERMLQAAGVPLEHDPTHVIFGDRPARRAAP